MAETQTLLQQGLWWLELGEGGWCKSESICPSCAWTKSATQGRTIAGAGATAAGPSSNNCWNSSMRIKMAIATTNGTLADIVVGVVAGVWGSEKGRCGSCGRGSCVVSIVCTPSTEAVAVVEVTVAIIVWVADVAVALVLAVRVVVQAVDTAEHCAGAHGPTTALQSNLEPAPSRRSAGADA